MPNPRRGMFTEVVGRGRVDVIVREPESSLGRVTRDVSCLEVVYCLF